MAGASRAALNPRPDRGWDRSVGGALYALGEGEAIEGSRELQLLCLHLQLQHSLLLPQLQPVLLALLRKLGLRLRFLGLLDSRRRHR